MEVLRNNFGKIFLKFIYCTKLWLSNFLKNFYRKCCHIYYIKTRKNSKNYPCLAKRTEKVFCPKTLLGTGACGF